MGDICRACKQQLLFLLIFKPNTIMHIFDHKQYKFVLQMKIFYHARWLYEICTYNNSRRNLLEEKRTFSYGFRDFSDFVRKLISAYRAPYLSKHLFWRWIYGQNDYSFWKIYCAVNHLSLLLALYCILAFKYWSLTCCTPHRSFLFTFPLAMSF